MSKSSFSFIFVLLLVWGVVIEMDNAYKSSMGISNIVMPTAKVMEIPSVVRDTVTEIPAVRRFDYMVAATACFVTIGDDYGMDEADSY